MKFRYEPFLTYVERRVREEDARNGARVTSVELNHAEWSQLLCECPHYARFEHVRIAIMQKMRLACVDEPCVNDAYRVITVYRPLN